MKNNNYSNPAGKTEVEMLHELAVVFNDYDDFTDFDAMVQKFADCDFYKLHYIAREYLERT